MTPAAPASVPCDGLVSLPLSVFFPFRVVALRKYSGFLRYLDPPFFN